MHYMQATFQHVKLQMFASYISACTSANVSNFLTCEIVGSNAVIDKNNNVKSINSLILL